MGQWYESSNTLFSVTGQSTLCLVPQEAQWQMLRFIVHRRAQSDTLFRFKVAHKPSSMSKCYGQHTISISYQVTYPESINENKIIPDITDHFTTAMDYDYSQKWEDLQQSMKKPTRTEEEEKKYSERKARELKTMLERAEVALEGNKKLFEKKGRPRATKTREIENSEWYFRR